MKNILCTISTKSHLYKVKALFDSIKKNDNCDLAVLIIDDDKDIEYADAKSYHINLLTSKSKIAKQLYTKYKSFSDKLRWSFKSVFIKHLLEFEGYEKVIYVDNDIYFYNKFDFIWNQLIDSNVLLTPHYYPFNPSKNQNWFEANFRVGLYNAGFFAINSKSMEVLDWWSNACLYRTEKNYFRGLFDDQKYLDLMPVIFPDVKVLRHQGCNVAEWNAENLLKNKVDNKIFINDSFPLVFYHFNNYSIQKIHETKNHILKEYFNQYFINLKEYKHTLKKRHLFKHESRINKIKLTIWNILNKLNK